MSGRLIGLGAAGLYLGPIARARLRPASSHRLYIVLSGGLVLRSDRGQAHLLPGEPRVLPAGTAHAIDGAGEMACLVMDAAALDPDAFERRVDAATREVAARRPEDLAAWSTFLARIATAGGADPRLERAIAVLRRTAADRNGLDRAARAAGWSASRLRHVARCETGVSLKRLRLWARLGRSISLARAGMTFTEAALAGGFGGSAHFSAAHTGLLGLSPTELRKLMRAGPAALACHSPAAGPSTAGNPDPHFREAA